MTLRLSTKRIIKSLCTLAGLLILLHIISLAAHAWYENRLTDVMVEKFSLENEGNFPTYFSAFLLFFAATLFGIIGRGIRLTKNSYWRYWWGLSLIFVFLSLDEAVQLHEKLDTDLIWSSFDTYGLLAWPWVILYGSLAAMVALIYGKFWWDLPGKYRVLFGLSAALYVGSAIGLEMFEAREFTTNGGATFKFLLLTSIEESLEITAIILVISTCFRYIGEHMPDLQISFAWAGDLRTS